MRCAPKQVNGVLRGKSIAAAGVPQIRRYLRHTTAAAIRESPADSGDALPPPWLATVRTSWFDPQAAALISAPVTLTTPLVRLTIGTAIGFPRAFSVRAMSSLSISSRVDLVNSSTSAAVRPVVGMGSSTAGTRSGPAQTKRGGGGGGDRQGATHLCRGCVQS